MGYEISRGTLGRCKSFAVGKYKHRKISKDSDHAPIIKVNERIYLSLSNIKATLKMEHKITNSNWRIMVDESTQRKFTALFNTQNGMVEPICIYSNKWNQGGLPVHKIRCDIAGENVLWKMWRMGRIGN